jgi:hypothetical protein
MLSILLRRVLTGYAAILKPVLFILALLAASAALSFAIALPLWFFATRYRILYSLFTAAAVAGTVVIMALRSRAGKTASVAGNRRRPFTSALFAIAWVCVLSLGVYFALLLSARGMIYLGAPLLAALLLLLGLAAWGARKKK